MIRNRDWAKEVLSSQLDSPRMLPIHSDYLTIKLVTTFLPSQQDCRDR